VSDAKESDRPGFDALRREYLLEIGEQLARARPLVAALESSDATDDVAAVSADLRALAHNWKGSGGGYRFPEISRLGEAIEENLLQGAAPPALREPFDALIAAHAVRCRELGIEAGSR
jgi:hypothetical protein